MKVEVMFLVENTTPNLALAGEFGQALFIKVDGRGFLFDTGKSETTVKNLIAMGVDPGSIEAIVLSHGHLDHAGGLPAVLDYLGPRDVYVHPDAFWPKYAGLPGVISIGMPERKSLEEKGARFILTETSTEFMPGVFITGFVPRENDFEDAGGLFAQDCGGGQVRDMLGDDQAIIIDYPDGLIVISGCAHAGMINTVEYAKKMTGKEKVAAWIGGTHLITATQERIEKTIDRLREYDIDKLVVSHCTGFVPSAMMFARLGDRVIKGETGNVFVFEK